jgi:hypothetical protein
MTRASAPASKNGENCSSQLGEYEHFIGCKSHGLHFTPIVAWRTLYVCYQDALRTMIIKGQAFFHMPQPIYHTGTENLGMME